MAPRRFHEMPPDELAAVLESLMDAHSLSAPDLTARSEASRPFREAAEEVPRKVGEAQERPSPAGRSPQTGSPEESITGSPEESVRGKSAESLARATVGPLSDSGLERETNGVRRGGSRGPEQGGAAEGSGQSAGLQKGGEEAEGRQGRSVKSGPGEVGTDATGFGSQGRMEVMVPESATPQAGPLQAGTSEAESIRRSERYGQGEAGKGQTFQGSGSNGQTAGLRTEEAGERGGVALGRSGGGVSGGKEEGGDVAANVSERGSQEEVPVDSEEASDVTMERLRAAGVDVNAFFSSGGVGGSVESRGGKNDAASGDPLGAGSLAGALIEKARGLRVDPDALFAPVRGVFPTAGFEKAFEEARVAVRNSEAVTGLEDLRASVAEKGLTEAVAGSWGKQGLSLQLGVMAALVVVVTGLVAALRGAWKAVAEPDTTTGMRSSEQGDVPTGRGSSPNNRRWNFSREPSLSRGALARDAAGTEKKELGVDGARHYSSTRGGRVEERRVRSRPDVSRAADDVSGEAAATGGKVLWVRGEESEGVSRTKGAPRASDRLQENGLMGSRRDETIKVRGLEGIETRERSERELADGTRIGSRTEKPAGEEMNGRSQLTGASPREDGNARQPREVVRLTGDGAVASGEKPLEAGGVTPDPRELGSVTQLLSRRRPKRGGRGLELLSSRKRELGVGRLLGEDGGNGSRDAFPVKGAGQGKVGSAAGWERRRSGESGQKGESVHLFGGGAMSRGGAREDGNGRSVTIEADTGGRMERSLGADRGGSGREAEDGVHSLGFVVSREEGAEKEHGGRSASVDGSGSSRGGGMGQITDPRKEEGSARGKKSLERRVGEGGSSNKNGSEKYSGTNRSESDAQTLYQRRPREGRPSRGLHFFAGVTKAEHSVPRKSPSLAPSSEGRRYLQPIVLGWNDDSLRSEDELHHPGDSAEHTVEGGGRKSVGVFTLPEGEARAELLPRVSQAGEREAGRVFDWAVGLSTSEGASDGSRGRRYVRPTLEASRGGGWKRVFGGDVALTSATPAGGPSDKGAPHSREGPGFAAEANMMSASANVTSEGPRSTSTETSTTATPPHTAEPRTSHNVTGHRSTNGSVVGRGAVSSIGFKGVSASDSRGQIDWQTVAAEKKGDIEHIEGKWREAFRHSRRDVWADSDVLS